MRDMQESKLKPVENETLLIIYLSLTNDSNITNVFFILLSAHDKMYFVDESIQVSYLCVVFI